MYEFSFQIVKLVIQSECIIKVKKQKVQIHIKIKCLKLRKSLTTSCHKCPILTEQKTVKQWDYY